MTDLSGARLLIAQDTEGRWFVRRIAYSTQDDTRGEMIYHCDMHLGGPHDTLRTAVASILKEKNNEL